MEIIGYSERGAMNALFYGMAAKNDGDDNMRKFLKLAGFDNSKDYSNFELYMEFSLSTFGSPDLVIKAAKGKESVVFFVEAKVSACNNLSIEKIIKGKDKDTSNLIFQLKQKKAFFESRKELPKNTEKYDKVINTNLGPRKIGNNPIVRRFVDKIKNCSVVEYIAIIPEMNDTDKLKEETGIKKLKIVFWESIYKEFKDIISLEKTFKSNQGPDPITVSKKIKSQITNKPLPKE